MIIVSDFDGTITQCDVVDEFLDNFADKKWLDIEKEWIDGRISSKECLEKQLNCVKKVSIKDLSNFLFSVKLDPYFKDFVDRAERNRCKIYIISDGFDFFIKEILYLNNIFNIEIFANKVTYQNERLKIIFPLYSDKCKVSSGICKCNIYNKLKSYHKNKTFVYIGDGKSDFCIAENLPDTDILFAKNKLAKHLSKCSRDYVIYNNFKEINYYLSELCGFQRDNDLYEMNLKQVAIG
jgi:2-hydroxy-3-keto-5-methylthiopentenyl-1-phosphate phosphatase